MNAVAFYVVPRRNPRVHGKAVIEGDQKEPDNPTLLPHKRTEPLN